MGILSKFLLSITITGITISSAIAGINNQNDFFRFDKVRMFDQTDNQGFIKQSWFAKPLRVQEPENSHLKPKIMWLHLYTIPNHSFNQYVEINCKEPTKSRVMTADGDKISLKNSMSYPNNPKNSNFAYRIERGAVEGLFAYYFS